MTAPAARVEPSRALSPSARVRSSGRILRADAIESREYQNVASATHSMQNCAALRVSGRKEGPSMIVLYTTERDYPWGTLRSTHASKTKVVLEEKQIPYRIENLPPGNLWKKPPEMLAKHPLGKVPYIEEQDRVIFDSTVIDEYLEERYQTGTRLMPLDPAARVQVREAEQF